MGNQTSKLQGHPTRTTYEKVTFVIAFVILLLEVAVLITSPVWESNAPQWAEAILDSKGELLGVAAAVALILSLLLGLNPSRWPMLATLFSGVLGFAAALFNLDLEADNLSKGLALLCLVLPFAIIWLPMLQFPQKVADWLVLIAYTSLMYIAVISVILEVRPVTQWMIKAGFLRLGNIWVISLILSVLIIAVIVVIQLGIQAVVQFIAGLAWPRKVWLWICARIRKPPPRSERRRSRARR